MLGEIRDKLNLAITDLELQHAVLIPLIDSGLEYSMTFSRALAGSSLSDAEDLVERLRGYHLHLAEALDASCRAIEAGKRLLGDL